MALLRIEQMIVWSSELVRIPLRFGFVDKDSRLVIGFSRIIFNRFASPKGTDIDWMTLAMVALAIIPSSSRLFTIKPILHCVAKNEIAEYFRLT
jgi:hypothetical protein